MRFSRDRTEPTPINDGFGADIATMESAHKDLVNYYFDSQKQRVNDFDENFLHKN